MVYLTKYHGKPKLTVMFWNYYGVFSWGSPLSGQYQRPRPAYRLLLNLKVTKASLGISNSTSTLNKIYSIPKPQVKSSWLERLSGLLLTWWLRLSSFTRIGRLESGCGIWVRMINTCTYHIAVESVHSGFSLCLYSKSHHFTLLHIPWIINILKKIESRVCEVMLSRVKTLSFLVVDFTSLLARVKSHLIGLVRRRERRGMWTDPFSHVGRHDIVYLSSDSECVTQ